MNLKKYFYYYFTSGTEHVIFYNKIFAYTLGLRPRSNSFYQVYVVKYVGYNNKCIPIVRANSNKKSQNR